MTQLKWATLAAVAVAVAGFVTPTAGADPARSSGSTTTRGCSAVLARSLTGLPSSTGSAWTSSASRCAGIRSPRGSRSSHEPPGPRVSLAQPGPCPDRAEQAWHRCRRHARRHSKVGQRRLRRQLGAGHAHGVRRLRVCGGEPLSVRPLLDDLERPQPGPVAEAQLAEDLRDPTAQPGVRGDQASPPRGARRR